MGRDRRSNRLNLSDRNLVPPFLATFILRKIDAGVRTVADVMSSRQNVRDAVRLTERGEPQLLIFSSFESLKRLALSGCKLLGRQLGGN